MGDDDNVGTAGRDSGAKGTIYAFCAVLLDSREFHALSRRPVTSLDASEGLRDFPSVAYVPSTLNARNPPT